MTLSTAGAVMLLLAAMGVSSAGAAGYPVVQGIGPRYTTDGGASVLSTTQTVSHWHSSFVDGLNGQTYGFNMVGSDPGSGGSSTVKTELIPINFKFEADGGYPFNGGQAASWATQSPIFQPTALPTENAQYLDAVMRSEFNKIGSTYHTKVENTGTLPTQTIDVPRDQGAVYEVPGGTLLGLVNYQWFEAQLHSILVNSGASPTTLPIAISNDVYLYIKSLSNCCVIGFHGAGIVTGKTNGPGHGNGNQSVLTYAWASWIPSSDIFGPGLTDVAALSHEISEWGHDPFVDNYVNPWSVPDQPQYGCTNVLETGDPLVGTDFAAGSTNPDQGTGPAWHLQDEAFLWWFERSATSPASNGAYSYMGTFKSGAPAC